MQMPFYFDLETVARDGADALLREPKAKSNLVDPLKIAADMEKKAAAIRGRLSLDPYGCRIVAAGWACDEHGPVRVHICPCEDNERWAVSTLMDLAVAAVEVITFNGKTFDLPVLLARAWLLGLTVPETLRRMVEKRYDARLIDLYDVVTFGQGRYEHEPAISRGLVSMCRVFDLGIPDDEEDGSQIAQMVAEGRWSDVEEHCRRDVARTRALAQRLKVSAVNILSPELVGAR